MSNESQWNMKYFFVCDISINYTYTFNSMKIIKKSKRKILLISPAITVGHLPIQMTLQIPKSLFSHSVSLHQRLFYIQILDLLP